MKKSFPYFFLILLLLNAYPLHAQITFHKVSLPVGSFAGFVGGMAQDNNGFLWIATKEGLYRYDGYRFKLYTNDPADVNSISTISLETVYADRKGFIWILTYVNGVDRLDPVTGQFMHFRHKPNDPRSLSSDTARAILEDREGNLWIGSHQGLDRYDPKTGSFHHYRHHPDDPYSLSCNQVRKIYEDKQGALWVGTGSVWQGEGGETAEGGLNRFDKKTGKFIRYLHAPGNPHSLISNKVQAIFEDSRGTFWVGTAGDGLHTMNRAAGTFQRHLYNPEKPEGLSRPPVNVASNFSDHITFITEDALGSIWIGTLGNGLNQYDPESGKTEHYARDTAAGFTDNSAWTSYSSTDGILWISTWQGALYRMDPYRKNISRISTAATVLALNEDGDNNLWIGTAQGLVVKNKKTNVSKKFVHDPSVPGSLSHNIIRRILRDREGTIWVGTVNGLNRFHAPSNTFTRWQNNPKDSSSISAGSINTIIEAGADFLWLGTTNGLDLMNKRTGTFTHFKNSPNDTNSLSRNTVFSLLADPSANLWAGTFLSGGLNYLNRKTGRFKHYLKGTSVFSLFRDSHGVLWAGTNEGLYRTNNPADGFTKFTNAGGGIENTRITSIQEDNEKNIWARASNGIYKIKRSNYQVTFFSTDVNFRYRATDAGISPFLAGYKGKTGEIYFGDVYGYFVIPPDKLITNPTPPQVVLTDFRLSGKSVLPGANSPLAQPLQSAKKITLGYKQNIFSFDFAGIHFSSPEHNRQLYRLENYDLDWREGGSEKTAYYYNVPPGSYVFKVKAASSGGVWIEKAVAVIVHPPWWRTWWAYCLYGLLFVCGVYIIHRFQKQRVIAAERERARVREVEHAKEIEKAYKELKDTQAQLIQSEKMASLGELTAGIAHEIQNPLNFINNFSEVNSELIDDLKGEIDEGDIEEVKAIANDIKENEQKIIHHGKRADAIVKGMLQHSRASTGQKEPTDINALADEYLLLSYHGLRAKDKSFNATIETHFDESIEKIDVVPQDIGRVLFNLFNNAFYAVQQKKEQLNGTYEPEVSIRTKKVDGKIEIGVRDNGTGIPQKVLDKIFQPFFTTKPTGKGTGLGLSLSYDIVKAHGGRIKTETKEGEYTEFTIKLPLQIF